ncbi:MAG TPA: class I SAM-dependent methyltransferase [Micromonosporaceae bacterium]|nr:class I SAM-dependent methyltransferase [Micromonosporaceae bacterium]
MTTFWTDPHNAMAWARGDAQTDVLALPRTIAADIVARDRPEARHVVDVGSGPGAFLAHFLRALPNAAGRWLDVSDAMMALARDNLHDFGDRVEYAIGDMTDLSTLPSDVDAIITSRASHHLDRDGLRAFYRDAAGHLAPGGWLVNLDHTGPDEAWNTRLRASRKALIPRVGESTPHHHTYPLTSIDDHMSALADAGFTDVGIPWRAFVTVLFMARRGV